MLTGTRPSWRNFSFFTCLLDRGRFIIRAAVIVEEGMKVGVEAEQPEV